MPLHASTLAVLGPHTEQALSWESNVCCSHNKKFRTKNLLFAFEPKCIHTLNKRFRGKAMFLVFNFRLLCPFVALHWPIEIWVNAILIRRSKASFLQRYTTCLYFLHLMQSLFGLFTLFVFFSACHVKAFAAVTQICHLWSWWARLVLLYAPSHCLRRLIGARVKSCCLPVVWKQEKVFFYRRDLLGRVDLEKHWWVFAQRKVSSAESKSWPLANM